MTGFSDAEYAERICAHPKVQIAGHGKRDKAHSISRTGIAGFQWERVKTRGYIVDAISQYLTHDQGLPDSSHFSVFRPNRVIVDLAEAQRKFLNGRVLTTKLATDFLGGYDLYLISGTHFIFIQFIIEYDDTTRTMFMRGVLFTKVRIPKTEIFARHEFSFSRQRAEITSFVDGYTILTKYHLNVFFREEKSNEYFFIKIPLMELALKFSNLSDEQWADVQENNIVVLPKAYIDPDNPPRGILKFRTNLLEIDRTTWFDLSAVRNLFLRNPRKKKNVKFSETPYERLWDSYTSEDIPSDCVKYIKWMPAVDSGFGCWVDLRGGKYPFEDEALGTFFLIHW